MKDQDTKIIAGGQDLAFIHAFGKVQDEIVNKYAEELKTAGLWKRFRIHRKIKKEIKEKMRILAPPGGLY